MLAFVASLAACGGGSKPADSPENALGDSKGGDSSSSPSKKDPDEDSPPPSSGASGGAGAGGSAAGAGAGAGGGGAGDAPSGGKTPYDKDAVEIELKRAARQVKSNCGSATDDNGAATGPWGKLTANITLGRNGHIKQVTVPSDYDGKPVGLCIVHAFQKILFPPYASSSDATLDYPLEIVKPKK